MLKCLSCICRVFKKYHYSFKLNKCNVLQPRCEYIRIDITKDGNIPASSKYQKLELERSSCLIKPQFFYEVDGVL